MLQRHTSRRIRSVSWRALAAAGWLIAAAMVARRVGSSREGGAPVAHRFPVELPDSVEVANGVGVKLALSRDGSQLVIAGMKQGRRALYLRRSAEVEARLVAGTDSAYNPSFSPDGRWLLFQAGTQLLEVPTAGGTPRVVLDSVIVASRGDDGGIVFERGNALWRVGANGGAPRRIATPDGSRGFRRYSWPEVLPGSGHALITIWRGGTSLDSARLGVVDLRNGEVDELGVRGANAHYAAPGHVVFAQVGGTVAAVPFSLRRRAVTGPVTPLLRNVWTGGGGGTDFAVADDGTLAYHGGVPEAEEMTMLAVDLTGRARPLASLGRQRFGEPRLSPDGRHVAVSIGPPPPSDSGEVWVYDLETGDRTRLSAQGPSIRPAWTRDGSRVVFISRQRDSQFVVSRRWDGRGAPEVLARGPSNAFYEVEMGPAGGWSAVRTGLAPGGSAIRIAPTDSLSAQRPFDTGARVTITPEISPDGRSIAYVNAVAGRRELFVRPLPGPGEPVAVSREGGTEPVWSPDGRTLYFRGLTHLMAAPVSERPALAVGVPTPVFPDTFHRSVAHAGYDVFPDGRELLMLGGWSRAQARVYVLVNWTRAAAAQPAAH